MIKYLKLIKTPIKTFFSKKTPIKNLNPLFCIKNLLLKFFPTTLIIDFTQKLISIRSKNRRKESLFYLHQQCFDYNFDVGMPELIATYLSVGVFIHAVSQCIFDVGLLP